MLSSSLRPLWQGHGSHRNWTVAGCWPGRLWLLGGGEAEVQTLRVQWQNPHHPQPFCSRDLQGKGNNPCSLCRAESDFKTPNSCHQMSAPTGRATAMGRAAPVSSFIKILSLGKRERSPHSLLLHLQGTHVRLAIPTLQKRESER